MKLNSFSRVLIVLICTLEQMSYVAGTIWLIGWQGWSCGWLWLTMLLVIMSSPSLAIRAVEKA